MLLILMVAVAVMAIMLLQVAQNYRRSILREREVEMIHRGEQYERAVRRFYHKMGSYPTTIEQLENTNKIRFLRQRYKDPMTADGQWKPVHLTDIKLAPGSGLAAAAGATATQTQGGGLNSVSGGGLSSTGATGSSTDATANAQTGNNAGIAGSQPAQSSSTNSIDTSASSGTSSGSAFSGPAGAGASNPVGTSGAGAVLGGGPILGVVSKSTAEGIHVFAQKSKYSEWYFIYDPSQDKGQQLVGPYNPNLAVGGTVNAGAGGQTQGQSTPGAPGASPGATSQQPTNSVPSTVAP